MTKLRGEVPFSIAGEGAFFKFTISDLVELEESQGEDFFSKLELAVQNSIPKVIAQAVIIGLRQRQPDGKSVKMYSKISDLDDIEYHLMNDAGLPLLNAVSLAVSGDDYDELLRRIAEAEQDQVNKAAKSLKEASDEAGFPLDEKALVNAILGSGIQPG